MLCSNYDADDEKKDEFYLQLQAIVEKVSTKDMVMMVGDFNAKIGSDNTGYEDTMGTQGLGVMNDNGERFADLCANNQLVIEGSIFPHKRIHKATWISPDHVMENQIDHICISRKFRRAWQDVRVRRGADVTSDHHLLLTTVRLRLKKNITASNQRTKFNVGMLRDQSVQEKFSIDLSNRFQPLQELLENEETEIEHNYWNHSKKLWLDTCEQILGPKKMQHKDWISESTILEIETRKAKKMVLNQSRTRTAKVKAQAEYNTANKRVKEIIKKDKNDYVDSLASQAEEAAGQGNIKELYMLSKMLALHQKIQCFVNTCLRRILGIRWPDRISNTDLWERAGQEPLAKQILQRKWGWIGHTLKKPPANITRQALSWNPQGKRRRGRPCNSWRRDTEAELKAQKLSWKGACDAVKNGVCWGVIVDGLCSNWKRPK